MSPVANCSPGEICDGLPRVAVQSGRPSQTFPEEFLHVGVRVAVQPLVREAIWT